MRTTFVLSLVATFGMVACTPPKADDDGGHDVVGSADDTTGDDDEAEAEDDGPGECGDGTVDPDEQCDLGGYRCGSSDGLRDFNWERVIMHAE